MKGKKRGPVQAPFCQLTPQNRNTVEVVFRPPREANLVCCLPRLQIPCQVARPTGLYRQIIENEGVIVEAGCRTMSPPCQRLQNPTELVRDRSNLWEKARPGWPGTRTPGLVPRVAAAATETAGARPCACHRLQPVATEELVERRPVAVHESQHQLLIGHGAAGRGLRPGGNRSPRECRGRLKSSRTGKKIRRPGSRGWPRRWIR